MERLTCSKLVKDHLALPRTTVVYAAIEVAKFAELPDRDQARRQLGLPVGDVPIVGLVGRIARWKGQDRFIRIAANVLARRDAHFCIIGSPIFGCDMEYVEGLHADVKQRHLEPYMTFVPWQESMEHVYAAIDIACNVSTREPFGRTTLEALASGVPSICFDDAGVCEIFERQHGASQVAAGNETAFASAILDYLTEPERLARARDGARQIARQMDISRAYAEFVAAIERSANVAPRSAEPSGAIDTSTTASAPDGRQDDECLVS